MDSRRFVFFDFHGKRWNRVRWSMLLFAGVALVLGIVFVRSVFVLPKLRKPEMLARPEAAFQVPSQTPAAVPPSPQPPSWLHRKKPGSSTPVPRREVLDDEPVFLAFYQNGDAASFASLQSHYRKITHVSPDGFSMRSFEQPLVTSMDEELVAFSDSSGVKLLPLLKNAEGNEWHPEIVEDLARHPEKRAPFFSKLREELQAFDAAGVLIDWEQLDPAYRSELTALITELSRFLHEESLELWLAVPIGKDVAVFDLDALAPSADRFVALLYDENGEMDTPGPLASLPWWKEWSEVLLAHGTSGQWVLGIGNYGYDWPAGERAATLSFADSMARAQHGGSRPVTAEAPLYHPGFLYEENRRAHSVWFLDAVTFRNQLALALEKHVGGVALYRLGTEDPALWQVVAHPDLPARNLESQRASAAVANIGNGDLLTASNEHEPGRREIRSDGKGTWTERYSQFPKGPLIYHRGTGSADQVVLSFDDGPDPVWTPQILDILKAEDVKAVFFMVGTQALENPDLVRRILSEGHELGNHTYTHPDLSEATAQRTVFELNANQRILEGIAGVSTLLFRPPYHADTYPQSLDEFTTLVRAQELGYLTVTESIDSRDWDEPSAESILERVKQGRAEGRVILLHDGGGDRSATAEALPQVIHYLRQRGDRIVSLQALLNLPREALMPAIPPDDPRDSRMLAQTGLRFMDHLEDFAWTFLLATTVVLFVRTGVVVVLAFRHRSRERRHGVAVAVQAPVSVIVPAYNEGKVIASTIHSVLACHYPGPLELIVVDDGSTDDTLAVLQEIAVRDTRLTVLSQPNRGKAHALNHALQAARHEIVVTLDADTQLRPGSLQALVAAFADDDVGAVSGHVRVGNSRHWITRFQALEYLCGFNLDRRAYDEWNAITVVPGALSAVRKSAIERVGGITDDTLAEDTDLTLGLHRAGYHIRYARCAIADTEAPERFSTFLKQRIRWAFGTLQCLWKYRDLVGDIEHPGLGLFSLPSVWFCHVFLVALVPLVDVMLLISLFWGAGLSLVGYAVLLLAVEWILAVVGCILEGEPLRTSLRIFPMRVVYRPLLCFAVWVSILRALRGAWYGWGKLDRNGSVNRSDRRGTAAAPRSSPARSAALLVPILCLLGMGSETPRAETAAAISSASGTGSKIKVPQQGAYAGAYIDFGEHEDEVTLEGIERFDRLVGKSQAIVAFASDWGNQAFPEQQLRVIANYGAVPLVYWSPWDRGDEEKPPPDGGRFNPHAIVTGKWDAYIDHWASQAKEFGKPFFVSWGLEMNGFWFPWSGYYHGRGKPVPGCKGCYAGPEAFKKAYRHVVDRARANGASNILWVWHTNNTSDPDQPWNAMASYYPGPQYVDWIAMSAYGAQYPTTAKGWVNVDFALRKPYSTLCSVDPGKPVMLAEWGVGEFPKAGSKAQWITEFFQRLPKDFPRIRAIVFWHERWQNKDESISNLRVNSSPEALEAYRAGIGQSYWLSRPEYEQ